MNIKKWIGIVLIISFIVVLCITLYEITFNTICIDGTVNTIDDKAVITFNSFNVGEPDELNLPEKYKFKDGSRVSCTIKTTTIFGVRYFKVVDVVNKDTQK